MADFLNLALSDYTDTASKVSLLTGRWKLRWGGYQPAAGTGRGKITETLALVAEGTAAELSAGERLIQSLLEQARRWSEDSLTENGVWLEWSVDGEPGAGTYAAKRVFLYDGTLALARVENGKGAFALSTFGSLAITRHACWENETVRQVSVEGVALHAGVVDLTAQSTYAGTENGRIAWLVMGPSAGQLRTWIGIRPVYDGITQFTPLWELESGTDGTDTTDVADATAHGGNKIQCTFATVATMAERSQILLGDVCGSNYIHNVGRYLVLLRAKLSASSTACQVQMRSGFDGTSQLTQGEYVYITDTAWHLYELGQIQIPPSVYRYETDSRHVLPTFGIWLDAERMSGSGYLDMDCLFLIPAWGIAMTNDQGFSGTASTALNIFIYPDDSSDSNEVVGSTQFANPSLALSNWCMPRTPGVLVVAGERTAGSDLTDTVDMVLSYYPRWRLYRGV